MYHFSVTESGGSKSAFRNNWSTHIIYQICFYITLVIIIVGQLQIIQKEKLLLIMETL